MKRIIHITSGKVSLKASLDQSETANAIWEALPLEGIANCWGEEVYFAIPLDIPESPNARQEMAVGELGYWPPGAAFCIFYGPTPASTGDLPKAFSNVNPFGRVEDALDALREIRDGEWVMVEKAEG